MRRIKEDFLDILEAALIGGLNRMTVLEIGCGNGMRSVDLAKRCHALIGIDPDPINVGRSRQRNIPNATFSEGKAELLEYPSATFDIVVFTLSFHHVPAPLMPKAIDEAVRVVKPSGNIVFLEPGMTGSFFDAEIVFDACDGDEREEKRCARRAMMAHPRLEAVGEYPDETIFEFATLFDFEIAMKPKRNTDALELFLADREYRLVAERRINIFRPKLS